MKQVIPFFHAALAAGAVCVGATAPVLAADKEPVYENFVDFAVGGSQVSGDRNNFQKVMQHQKDASGGLEGFHYGTQLDKTTSLVLDGRALAGENDYNFDLTITRDDVGSLNLGYNEYRTWFDGSGGYFPPNAQSFRLYSEEMYVDRSDLWLAGAFQAPHNLHLDFRYDFTTRKGLKDSTEWGDTSLTGGLGTRAIVPTFLRINEHRHIFKAKLSQDADNLSWAIDGRIEKTSIDNDREIQRAPGEKTNRYVTQNDGSDSDLFMIHGAVERRFTEQLSMSTAIAHYDIDTNISGSRIAGISYDPVFDPAYASRQYHDEGFIDLTGGSRMKQTIANLNLMYQPDQLWTFVPSLRAEKTTWSMQSEFVETAVGAGPKFDMTQEELEGEGSRNLRSLTEGFEARYTGLKNTVVTMDSQWLQSYGTLAEDLIALETGVDTIFRTTNYRQDQQKYTLTANWYAKPGLSFTAQGYWKGRQNSFNDSRDNTPDITGGDRYPGYIAKQDFETADANIRMSWSPLAKVRLITRYDYQDSAIRTRKNGLTYVESAKMKTHIVSESATWNPLARWYLQANANVVYDQLTTPATTLTGAAGGSVTNSDNNYVSWGLASGYVIDDRTDVSADYNSYRANNFINNAGRSQPYGAAASNQTLGLTLHHRINAHLNCTVKYVYVDNDDETSGGLNSFRAHSVYGKVQYRF